MDITLKKISRCSLVVHHILETVIESPTGMVTLKDVEGNPWYQFREAPQPGRWRKALHDMTEWGWLQRRSRGVYSLAPRVRITDDARLMISANRFVYGSISNPVPDD